MICYALMGQKGNNFNNEIKNIIGVCYQDNKTISIADHGYALNNPLYMEGVLTVE